MLKVFSLKTVVTRTWHSENKESFDITFTVPLNHPLYSDVHNVHCTGNFVKVRK